MTNSNINFSLTVNEAKLDIKIYYYNNIYITSIDKNNITFSGLDNFKIFITKCLNNITNHSYNITNDSYNDSINVELMLKIEDYIPLRHNLRLNKIHEIDIEYNIPYIKNRNGIYEYYNIDYSFFDISIHERHILWNKIKTYKIKKLKIKLEHVDIIFEYPFLELKELIIVCGIASLNVITFSNAPNLESLTFENINNITNDYNIKNLIINIPKLNKIICYSNNCLLKNYLELRDYCYQKNINIILG
jgi:hypothetical protein